MCVADRCNRAELRCHPHLALQWTFQRPGTVFDFFFQFQLPLELIAVLLYASLPFGRKLLRIMGWEISQGTVLCKERREALGGFEADASLNLKIVARPASVFGRSNPVHRPFTPTRHRTLLFVNSHKQISRYKWKEKRSGGGEASPFHSIGSLGPRPF